MAANSLPVEHLFTLSCTTAPPIHVPEAPGGTRLVYAVTGGTFEGPRIRGTVIPSPGGDWATLRPDGTVRVDVRLVLQTDDGVTVCLTYTGVAVRNADGAVRIRTAGGFETGPGVYAWLNSVQAVGLGEARDRQVTYEVYRLL